MTPRSGLFFSLECAGRMEAKRMDFLLMSEPRSAGHKDWPLRKEGRKNLFFQRVMTFGILNPRELKRQDHWNILILSKGKVYGNCRNQVLIPRSDQPQSWTKFKEPLTNSSFKGSAAKATKRRLIIMPLGHAS